MIGHKQSRRAALAMLGAVPLGAGLARAALAQPVVPAPREPALRALVEPGAGGWKTWLLQSGSQMRLPPPPDSAAEVADVSAMAGRRDAAALDRIAFWDAGSAAYRWNEIAIDLCNVKGNLTSSTGGRALALMNAAIYDAAVAAWDAKYAYNRPRPSEVDPSLATAVATPPSPSYPSEHAVAAGAASAVLAHLFPKEADALAKLADEAATSRVLAGVQYPSDTAAGRSPRWRSSAPMGTTSVRSGPGRSPTSRVSGPGRRRPTPTSRSGSRGSSRPRARSGRVRRRQRTRPRWPPS